jgi:Ca-activated chloride channel family protein
MRFHTYQKFSPGMADAVDLQSLLDNLADFLLQSGFAGGAQEHPFWGETGDDADKSLDGLKQAILDALIQSGQFTPDMLDALRGDGDELSEEKLAELLDTIVQRLIAEGFLKLEQPPEMPAGHQSVTGKGGLAQAAAKDVQFNSPTKASTSSATKPSAASSVRSANRVSVRTTLHSSPLASKPKAQVSRTSSATCSISTSTRR